MQKRFSKGPGCTLVLTPVGSGDGGKWYDVLVETDSGEHVLAQDLPKCAAQRYVDMTRQQLLKLKTPSAAREWTWALLVAAIAAVALLVWALS